MKPKALPPLSKEAFDRFEAQDKEELSLEEKKFLKECLETYQKNPIKF
jgi:hypothetical protein